MNFINLILWAADLALGFLAGAAIARYTNRSKKRK